MNLDFVNIQNIIVNCQCQLFFFADVWLRNSSLSVLQENVFSRLPESWVEVNSNASKLTFCHIVNTSLTTPVIKYTLTIKQDFSCTLSVLTKIVQVPYLIPSHIYTPESLLHVMANLINMNICNGNNDQHFQELAKKRKGKFTDRTGKHKKKT